MKRIVKLGMVTLLASSTFLGSSLISNDKDNVQASNIYSSCKAFNNKYPHGVRVSSKTKNKVEKRNGTVVYQYSSAKVSKKIYKLAMKKNPKLDRDKDNIACER